MTKIKTLLNITTAAMSLALAAPAMAFTVVQNNDPTTLLNALLGTTPGLSNFNISLSGDPNAFGLYSNAAAPFRLDEGVVLSTGQVIQLPGENQIDTGGADLSTNFGIDLGNGVFDRAEITITFDADATTNKLFFTYVFGSEEFLEFSDSQFNDSFQLFLNGINLALLGNGQPVTINNLTPVQNDASAARPEYVNNPAGPGTLTRLDGFTIPLLFEGNLIPNSSNTLVIRIQDIADGSYDSAVFIEGNISTINPNPNPSTPEPSAMAGFLALGVLGLTKKVRRLR